LDSILAEWTAAKPYGQRVRALQKGTGLNSPYYLRTYETLLDDGTRDVLRGEVGRDLFVQFKRDRLVDRTSAERLLS
jgi:hypothetical protein